MEQLVEKWDGMDGSDRRFSVGCLMVALPIGLFFAYHFIRALLTLTWSELGLVLVILWFLAAFALMTSGSDSYDSYC